MPEQEHEVKVVTAFDFEGTKPWSKREPELQDLYNDGWRIVAEVTNDGNTNAFVLERPK